MKQTINILFIIAFCILTILGCANRGGGPQGGPKDTTPPKLLKCTPENGSTNVSSNKIQLTFDEIVLVQSTFEKVVISPPQSQMAIIKASGHKVNVELQDSLKKVPPIPSTSPTRLSTTTSATNSMVLLLVSLQAILSTR